MKIIFIIQFTLCIIYSELHSQSSVADSNFVSKHDSITVMQQIGKTSGVIALTTLRISGQVVCGFIGGAIGGTLLQFNPVTAGVGFIIGSSGGVYLIGDIANGRGQYKWVLAAGAINGALYVPVFINNQHSGFGVIGIVALAMVTSVASEIITFYATQKDSDLKVSVSMTMLPSQKKDSYIPALNISLNF